MIATKGVHGKNLWYRGRRLLARSLSRLLERPHADLAVRFCRGRGIEIGAHDLPIPGIEPFYVDRRRVYANRAARLDVLAEAARLPFHDSALDYLAASHLIEHIPRPLQALREWHRVVRDGGYLYIIVPDQRKTFDRDRPLTSLEHVIEDDRYWSPTRDIPHAVDWSFRAPLEVLGAPLDPPEGEMGFRERYCRALVERCLRSEEIPIHYHVWRLASFQEILHHLGWEIEAAAEDYPPDRGDGFCVVVPVRKGSPSAGRGGTPR